MKKVCIIFLLSIIISLTAVGCQTVQKDGGMYALNGINTQYLRMHIRADSNETADQKVKYAVRDALVEYLTPIVAECPTRNEALQAVNANVFNLQTLANGVLQSSGFAYTANVKLCIEQFPTRTYGEYTLPAGEYTALIVELGRAGGDNWWCVIYPPLCFVGEPTSGNNIVYKSKILEIIQRFQSK